VLVGAIGMTVHGIIRATQAVDLFVRPEEANTARLRAALRAVFPGDTSINEITAADPAGEYPAIRLQDRADAETLKEEFDLEE
jgi:hypothetical protein